MHMQERAEHRVCKTYIHGGYLAKLTGLLQRQNIHFTSISDSTEKLLWKLLFETHKVSTTLGTFPFSGSQSEFTIDNRVGVLKSFLS